MVTFKHENNHPPVHVKQLAIIQYYVTAINYSLKAIWNEE